jgi:SP family sugar:H+ symporter-like MFS transporter
MSQADCQFEIGVIVQVSSFSLGQLAAGRCVAGLGVGAMSAIVPLYVGEAAPKKLRGSLLVLYQVQIATGLFLAYAVNLGTHKYSSDASWRVPIGLQLAWGIFLFSGALVLPESPRLLLGKGKEKEAVVAIAKLNEAEIDDPIVSEVVAELEDAIKQENDGGKAGWLECFSLRAMSMPCWTFLHGIFH